MDSQPMSRKSCAADSGRPCVTPLPGGVQLAVGGSPAYTVRATAQLYGRPVRRSVAALVRYGRDRTELPVGVVRWYQTAN